MLRENHFIDSMKLYAKTDLMTDNESYTLRISVASVAVTLLLTVKISSSAYSNSFKPCFSSQKNKYFEHRSFTSRVASMHSKDSANVSKCCIKSGHQPPKNIMSIHFSCFSTVFLSLLA